MKVKPETKLFLTGENRSGKSSIIEKLLSRQCLESYGGFFSRPILDQGKLKGFEIIDLVSKNRAAIAYFQSERQLLPQPEGFETVGIEALKNAEQKELLILDELGFLELTSPAFQKAVISGVKKAKKVLGVLKKETNPFLESIKALPGVTIREVRPENRQEVLAEVLNLFL